MKLPDMIKVSCLAYWKFQRQHKFGAIECWNSDVITVAKSMLVTETEVKISIADMRREIKTKTKHYFFSKHLSGYARSVHYFYFAVPTDIESQALSVCEELYPYAGLLVFNENGGSLYGNQITCVRKAVRQKRQKISGDEVISIAYIASNNVVSIANKQ